jgi:hypothetical protein
MPAPGKSLTTINEDDLVGSLHDGKTGMAFLPLRLLLWRDRKVARPKDIMVHSPAFMMQQNLYINAALFLKNKWQLDSHEA